MWEGTVWEMSLGQVVRISKGRAKNFGLCPSRNEDAPPPPPCLQLALRVTVASPMHQASTLPCLGPCHWYSLDANSSHFSPFSHLFNSTVFQRHCPCASRCHVPIASTAITLWCHSSLVWKWADHVSLKKKVEVELTYNVVFVSGVQQSDSVLYIFSWDIYI